MLWSAEDALKEFWSAHDRTKSNGEVRAHIKRALQAAYAAGFNNGVQDGRKEADDERAMVVFGSGQRKITVSVVDGVIHISADGAMLIRPRAANLIYVAPAD